MLGVFLSDSLLRDLGFGHVSNEDCQWGFKPTIDEMLFEFGYPKKARGALFVLQVEDGSRAANHGIVVGDVIMQFNGKRIEGSDHGKLLFAQVATKDKAKLSIFRNGKNLSTTL